MRRNSNCEYTQGPFVLTGSLPLAMKHQEADGTPSTSLQAIDDQLGRSIANSGNAGIQLWLFPLNLSVAEYSVVSGLLSRDERERASRYTNEALKRDFEIGRGLLRYLIGAYFDMHPAQICFDNGPTGKPSVGFPLDGDQLQFNFSHSGGWAIMGVAFGDSIGVDIERIRAFDDYLDVARSNFTDVEFQWLKTQRSSERLSAFYSCWTRKEAVVKADGIGIGYGLDRFEIPFDASGDTGFAQVHDPSGRLAGLHVQGFVPLEGFCGAVSVRSARPVVQWYRPLVERCGNT